MNKKFPLVIITGMSGAGKTVAVHSLEDLGFFCIDNLPPMLFPKFIELIRKPDQELDKVALVVDLRGRELFSSQKDLFDLLESHLDIQYKILFLDAENSVLVRRYKETRRRHPLAADGTLLQGIEEERVRLKEIREKAHVVIDTSYLRPTALKQKVSTIFADEQSAQFPIQFLSFGYKYGMPIDADLVFDVRFLPNPHYEPDLKPQTGKQVPVYDYVMKWTETKEFLTKLEDMLRFLIPSYQREGKSQLVIGIGCTGGRHRSVAITEYLNQMFQEGHRCEVTHRDIEKGG